VVRGSARELRQAVLNLLANAQEALADAPARALRVHLARTAGTIRLTVADTGPGVAADIRERIFEPFYTTRAAKGALGLGLTVAVHTAAAHGGRLLLERERPGASFVLELPDAG
jgi:C4-dicarboxylate-specific signal transduction histidine kinase